MENEEKKSQMLSRPGKLLLLSLLLSTLWVKADGLEGFTL